jgi:polyphosphate kinase 2 (PPK2 family)
MKRKEYEQQMRVLHGELVALQQWVKEPGAKICVVFEGRAPAQTSCANSPARR